MRLLLDYETRSLADLPKTGAWRYAADPSTEVLCVGYAWKVGTDWSPIHLYVNVWGDDPDDLAKRLVARGIRVTPRQHFIDAMNAATIRVAHNMEFERAITKCQMPEVNAPLDEWSCTMARAHRLGMPGSLDLLMEAMGGPPKDSEGNALIRRISKPRPTWKKKGTGPQWFQDAERLERAYIYAENDIISEKVADDGLPELEPVEKKRWLQNIRENTVGLRIDTDLVSASRSMADFAIARKKTEVAQYTKGEVSNIGSNAQVLKYCEMFGTPLPNLQAATVEEMLTKELVEPVRYILEAKAELAKSSVAKLDAIRNRLLGDGRIKDFQVFHGAHTGRNTGRGFQPLNLPRPGDVDVDVARPAILNRDLEQVVQAVAEFARKRQAGERAGVRSIKGPAHSVSVLDAVSACLRSTIIPSPGHKFVSADYSGVEMVFTMTFAEQWDAVEKIRQKEDMYCDLATVIYAFNVTKKNTEERQLGKQGVLGGGFGMTNPETFQATCSQYGMYISIDLAQKVIDAYSERFPKVPELWHGLNDGAVAAMKEPGATYQFKGINFHYDGQYWFTADMLNGSRIFYPDAKLKKGRWRDEIHYKRVINKRWLEAKTYGGKLTENFVQKMCRLIMEEHKHELLRRGLKVAFTIYDEILFDVPEEQVDWAIEQINDVMNKAVPWFPNMPLRADPEVFDFFRKGD